MRTALLTLLLASLATAQEGPELRQARPIDFSRIERKIRKLPPLRQPLYGLFLFGLNGEKEVWAVLDKSADGYDTLYLDRDADGDLTGKGERIPGTVASEQSAFSVGDFKDPATGAVHTEFKLTYRKKSLSFSMLWRGKQITMGCYGPRSDTYANFAPSLKEAPILVPGHDRPLTFEHWLSGTLPRGKTKWFKVFVGNRGSRIGTFSSTDDKFLPAGEWVSATLIYTDQDGKQQRYHAKLTEKC